MKSRLLENLFEYFAVECFACCCEVFKRRQIVLVHSTLYKISVNCRRCAERSYLVTLHNAQKLAGGELVKVIHHYSASAEPLTVDFAPRSLAPACFGNGKVKPLFLYALPVPCCDNMTEGVGVVVLNSLGVACRARGKVNEHRLFSLCVNSFKRIVGIFNLCCKVDCAENLFSAYKNLFKCVRLGRNSHQVLGGCIVGSADSRSDIGCVNSVGNIALCKKVRCRNDDCAELVERRSNVPVLVISLKNNKHLVTLFDSVVSENISRLVAESADVGKGEDFFFLFGICPHNSRIVGSKLRHFVNYVVTEIVVFGKVKLKVEKISVFIKCFLAKIFV